jgi:hypothetical protein
VVAEFSPATASAMGLAWAYHEHCRAGMEAEFLPALFAHGRDVAAGAAPAAAAGGAEAAGVCGAAVSLLCAVLSWDFRCSLAASRRACLERRVCVVCVRAGWLCVACYPYFCACSASK